jgi:hypothetical protein
MKINNVAGCSIWCSPAHGACRHGKRRPNGRDPGETRGQQTRGSKQFKAKSGWLVRAGSGGRDVACWQASQRQARIQQQGQHAPAERESALPSLQSFTPPPRLFATVFPQSPLPSMRDVDSTTPSARFATARSCRPGALWIPAQR